jgi:hypothetical protein
MSPDGVRIEPPDEDLPDEMKQAQRELMRDLVTHYRQWIRDLSNSVAELASRCVNCMTLKDTCPDCLRVIGQGVQMATENHGLEVRRATMNREYEAWVVKNKGRAPDGGFDA